MWSGKTDVKTCIEMSDSDVLAGAVANACSRHFGKEKSEVRDDKR